jgi:hypothetical protein
MSPVEMVDLHATVRAPPNQNAVITARHFQVNCSDYFELGNKYLLNMQQWCRISWQR